MADASELIDAGPGDLLVLRNIGNVVQLDNLFTYPCVQTAVADGRMWVNAAL